MRFAVFALAVLVLAVLPAGAAAKKQKKQKKHRAGIVELYPSLRGSKETGALEEENEVADKYELPRIESDEDLLSFIKKGLLLRVPDKTDFYYIDRRLKERFRYLAPYATVYLQVVAYDFSEEFGARLKITSFVRTPRKQKQLCDEGKSDACGNRRDRRSLHLTGYAFDISAKNLKEKQRFWLARRLAADIAQGTVLAIYEYRHQSNFHVMVVPPFAAR